jgi:hypothetical protein
LSREVEIVSLPLRSEFGGLLLLKIKASTDGLI